MKKRIFTINPDGNLVLDREIETGLDCTHTLQVLTDERAISMQPPEVQDRIRSEMRTGESLADFVERMTDPVKRG
jgi:hypothetical protein